MENLIERERELVKKKIRAVFEKDGIGNISVELVEDQFDIGNVYYAEFYSASSKERDDGDMTFNKAEQKKRAATDADEDELDEEDDEKDFFYALVRNDEVVLYDDGIEVIRGLNTELQRRKSFWQRFADFSLVDAVGALIAILLALTFVSRFVIQMIYGKELAMPDLDKELVSIFTVVVGYYFGRVSSGNSRKER